MVNRLYLQYNYDSSNLSFSKTLILSILPPLQKKKSGFVLNLLLRAVSGFVFSVAFLQKLKGKQPL